MLVSLARTSSNILLSIQLSNIISLRVKGDNDRALGIELLIEELYKRPLIMTEKNINMVTFEGVRTPVSFTKKAQVIKLLLDL